MKWYHEYKTFLWKMKNIKQNCGGIVEKSLFSHYHLHFHWIYLIEAQETNFVVLSIIHCQTSEICTQQIYNICFSLAWPTSYLISLGSSKIQTLQCPFKDWKEFRTHLPNCNASACELEDMIWRYARKNLARLNIFIKVSEKCT